MPRMAFSCISPFLFLAVVAQSALAEPLRALAERDALHVGAMVLDDSWKTPAQQALVAREFNAATVGTYWVRTHKTRQAWDWSLTDDVVEWARDAGLAIHLHPMLYPDDRHNPAWVLASDPREAPAILEEHIREAAQHFRGKVAVWDVVNEAVANSPNGGYRDCWWLRAMGPEYVVQAFRLARQYDPDAILVYNEHFVELDTPAYTAQWNTVKEILTTLDDEGLVDGFGWQLHSTPDDVLSDDFALADRMEWVAARGLKNFVTELDMPIGPGDEALARQAEAYRRVTDVWLAHHNGGWLQTWGVSDKHSWLGEGRRPLLFDEHYAPKPAYHAVQEALQQATSADFDADSDVDGADFLELQRGLGEEGEYDDDDTRRWKDQFGAPPPEDPAAAMRTPETGAASLAIVGWILTPRRLRPAAISPTGGTQNTPLRTSRARPTGS